MPSFRQIFVIGAALVLCVGAASAASFSGSDLDPGQDSQPIAGTVCGTVTLSQSASQTVTALNSVSCNNNMTGFHTDNSYYRAFDPANFGVVMDFNVCSVTLGIESAVAGGATQPVDVILYSGPAGFPTGFPGSYTQIGTETVDLPDQSLTVIEIPITATVPAGDIIVVEIFTPDGSVAGNTFFIGSNNLGETAPSYLAAADCGVTVPTPTGGIGNPQMQIVLEANGDEATGGGGGADSNYSVEVPTLDWKGMLALVALLGLAGFIALRRRA
ncbi:MAG: hypothetical protein AAGC60_29390 [Acidobacteriota bacterium]